MRVAVIGASGNRAKFGNKAVRAYLKAGHAVFPVNPKEKLVEGLDCYPTVLDIPGKIDAALLYVPPQVVAAVLPEIAEKGIKKVYFSPGTENQGLLRKAKGLGLEPVQCCAISAIGLFPADFP